MFNLKTSSYLEDTTVVNLLSFFAFISNILFLGESNNDIGDVFMVFEYLDYDLAGLMDSVGDVFKLSRFEILL